jgi:hypothetical protein
MLAFIVFDDYCLHHIFNFQNNILKGIIHISRQKTHLLSPKSSVNLCLKHVFEAKKEVFEVQKDVFETQKEVFEKEKEVFERVINHQKGYPIPILIFIL